MADKDRPGKVAEGNAQEIESLKRRLYMLDQRLDNIDSMVTAVAERVMVQPITLTITCPKCGETIEIAVLGRPKPSL